MPKDAQGNLTPTLQFRIRGGKQLSRTGLKALAELVIDAVEQDDNASMERQAKPKQKVKKRRAKPRE